MSSPSQFRFRKDRVRLIIVCICVSVAFIVILNVAKARLFRKAPVYHLSGKYNQGSKYNINGAGGATSVKFKNKFIHLDLKGAPPKVEYLQSLFALFHELDATGILIEYEDMLPYYDELAFARNGYAYTNEDLTTILESAKLYGLQVIPLVQTFGHLEWILKQQKYASLREVHKYPQVLCPSTEQGQKLVQTLIDQVVALHPYIDTIHIGSDEAYYIGNGKCQRCNDAVQQYLKNATEPIEGNKQRLLLRQISNTARYVKEHHNLRVLAWNDMLIDVPLEVMEKYDLGNLIEPVVWGYKEHFDDDYFGVGIFNRFKLIFPHFWIGSAFKGAKASDQTFIDVNRYLQNHLSWIQLIRDKYTPIEQNKMFQGIILTGWQRYDHFGPLCELLPNSIPSLAVNMALLNRGNYYNKLFDRARSLLKCVEYGMETVRLQSDWSSTIDYYQMTTTETNPLPIPLNSIDCVFTGANVYKLTEHLKLLQWKIKGFRSQSVMKWMNEYALNAQYGNVKYAEDIHSGAELLLDELKNIGRALEANLNTMFFDDTVNEWLYSNIQVYIDKLTYISRNSLMISKTVSFRNRPLENAKLEF